MRLDVPALVLQRAAANGAAGQQWLDSLPELVASLCASWELTLGTTYSGGTAGFVAQATTGEGTPCVLKIAMPLDMDEHQAFERSVQVHQLAAGRGCAELLRFDPTAPAMLIEQLGPNLDALGFDITTTLDTIAATLLQFWRSLEPDVAAGFPTGAEKAHWLANYITSSWELLDQPCSKLVIDQAIAFCDERAAAFDPSTAVLVHGDAHGWNTVRADNDSFKFVDPEGVWSEPAHDLSVPMREYNEPLLAGDTLRLTRERAERLAQLCNVDAEAVWQWGFIERVSTGLANVRDFEGDGGLMFLQVAERCL